MPNRAENDPNAVFEERFRVYVSDVSCPDGRRWILGGPTYLGVLNLVEALPPELRSQVTHITKEHVWWTRSHVEEVGRIPVPKR